MNSTGQAHNNLINENTIANHMISLGDCLRHYKRPDMQKAMAEAAVDKEVSVRFLDGNFGKRPDALVNPSDVIENAKQKAGSFHCSEELWTNPLQIGTNMRKEDLAKLRKGWDFVLDVDCPYWELAKLTTWLFIEALKKHGIISISLKFSGNKGFHIGVPFRAFPEKVPGKDILTKDYFPDGPRRIAQYLVDYIEDPHNKLVMIEDSKEVINFGGKIKYSVQKLKEMTGKSFDELTYAVKGGRKTKERAKQNQTAKYHYLCSCGNTEILDMEADYIKCRKCGAMVRPFASEKKEDSNAAERRFNSSSIINVDTVLIAPRHLYRMAYSLHEKSGLVSIPIDINRILLFEKEEAKPENLKMSSFVFLDDSNAIKGEAEFLLKQAFDFYPLIEAEDEKLKKTFQSVNIESLAQKIPEELFPPCIKSILAGNLKDGKKRSLFILINFLTGAKWNYDEIKERLDIWNKSNPEHLRENLIVGHLNYHRQQKKDVPPPNCPKRENNIPLIHQQNYYIDLQFCHPDGICSRIKNPLQYSKKRVWILNHENSKNIKRRKNRKETAGEKDGK